MYKSLALDRALSRMIPHDHQLEGFQVVSWLTFLKDLLSNKISFLYYFSNSLFFLFFCLFSHQTWVHTYSTPNQNCAAWCLRSVFELRDRGVLTKHLKRALVLSTRRGIPCLPKGRRFQCWLEFSEGWKLSFSNYVARQKAQFEPRIGFVTIAWLWRHALRDTGDEWIDKPTWIR